MVLWLTCAAAPAMASGADAGPFAITLHVASEQPERARALWEKRLATANRAFADAGVRFYVAARHELPETYATLDNIPERRRLKRRLVAHTINVFLVDAILDPRPSRSTQRAASWLGRAPSGALSGAHVEAHGRTPDTYILLSLAGSRTSLAHELGHFFGATHRREPDNLMSYGSQRDAFDEDQLRAFRRKARRARRTRELRTLASPDRPPR